MRTSSKNAFHNSQLIQLHRQDWLDKQRQAGKIVAQALVLLQQAVRDKTTHSLLELNQEAEKLILDAGATPTFKGYKGFPAGVCISVNKQLVHGIPGDYRLQEGDLVSFDLGATVEGAIADSALTCIYGVPKSSRHNQLVQATQECLTKGIESVAIDKQLGVIGHVISRCAKGYGLGLINNYGGHSLDWETPHAPPFVANKANPNEGVRIQAGMTLAIEPMLVMGSTHTHTLSDGWTVMTDDYSAHFEHTIFIHHDNSVEVITDRSPYEN